jgi:1,4-dihydroxy-2-naphthoate octaprenyltransferase
MKHPLKDWLIAARPWALPASTMPALIAISYVFYTKGNLNIEINWWFGVLALIGAAVFQTSGNLISDYFDFNYNVDRKESFGSSRMLVEKVFQPKEILNFGLIMLLIGSGIGLFLWLNTSVQLLWIGLLGVVGTYFYYKLKYMALGDLTIMIVFGWLISLGVFLVMTNQLEWKLLLISSSVGFLIVNILHANNMRDIKHDGEANIKTQAMLLGIKKSIAQYVILGYSAYLIIILSVILGFLHPLSLIVLLSLPILLKNVKEIRSASVDKPESIKDMDGKSAQLVMIFSLLLSISNFVAGIL